MSHLLSRLLVRVSAAVVLLLTAVPAWAQFRVGEDGGALDANQRLGSGGSNLPGGVPVNRGSGVGGFNNPFSGGTPRGYGSFQDNIVTGNVTGGRQFRGSADSVDPRAFRDSTGSAEFDAFNRQAAGATTDGRLIDFANPGSSRTFFGESIVAPPPGFERTPGGGGFVPQVDASVGVGAGGIITRGVTNPRFGGAPFVGTTQGNVSPLARLFDGGAADATSVLDTGDNTQTAVSRGREADSPEALLLGGRFAGSSASATLGDAGGRALSPYTRLGRDDRLDGLTAERLRTLGGELLRGEDGATLTGETLDALLRQPAGRAARGDDTAPTGIDAIERGVNLDDRVLRLADPAEQSATYARLQRRLDRLSSDPLAASLRRRGGIEQPVNPEEPDAARTAVPPLIRPAGDLEDDDAAFADDDAVGGAALPPRQDRAREAAEFVRNNAAADDEARPVVVDSFAEGVASPALHGLLADAEGLMTRGRYSDAVARYEAAGRLVPNQPLVMLGRGTAELGAGLYRRAADTLREGLSQNPELALARVGVADLLGDGRVGELVADLQRLDDARPNDDVAVFLLAYLAYGQGNDAEAGRLLDEASARSEDPFYDAIRVLWLGGEAADFDK